MRYRILSDGAIPLLWVFTLIKQQEYEETPPRTLEGRPVRVVVVGAGVRVTGTRGDVLAL